jgi:hypothetical protein
MILSCYNGVMKPRPKEEVSRSIKIMVWRLVFRGRGEQTVIILKQHRYRAYFSLFFFRCHKDQAVPSLTAIEAGLILI